MKDTTSFWTKQVIFQLLLAVSVLLIGDGVLRNQNDFVVWYLEQTSPAWPLSLWQGFMSASPFGTLALISLAFGVLLAVLLRDRVSVAESWLLQLAITTVALGSLWRNISLNLTAIWHVGRSSGAPHLQ